MFYAILLCCYRFCFCCCSVCVRVVAKQVCRISCKLLEFFFLSFSTSIRNHRLSVVHKTCVWCLPKWRQRRQCTQHSTPNANYRLNSHIYILWLWCALIREPQHDIKTRNIYFLVKRLTLNPFFRPSVLSFFLFRIRLHRFAHIFTHPNLCSMENRQQNRINIRRKFLSVCVFF